MEPFDAYFDFTCRFANRLHLWLGRLDVDVEWRPFSLLEAERGDDGPAVWEREQHADNISLLMLAGHEVVAGHGGDAATYRSRVFAAWHGGDQRLDASSVLTHMRHAGVDTDHDGLRGGLDLVGQRHRSAVARGVFGSSTVVFASGRGSFVRFAGIPSVDHAGDILAALRTIADRAPELDHLEPLRT